MLENKTKNETEYCQFCKLPLTANCDCFRIMIEQAESESIMQFEKIKKKQNEAYIPNILLAGSSDCWYLQSGSSQRRERENYYKDQVADFFACQHFEIKTLNPTTLIASKVINDMRIELYFYYEESTNYVYKKVTVHIDGKKSTRTRLWKIMGLR